MLVASNVYWFMFEGYNLHLRNWTYINLPDNVAVRMIGFIWSFATIFPGILLTNEVLNQLGLFRRAAIKGKESTRVDKNRSDKVWVVPDWLHRALIGVGFVFCVAPLLMPGEIARYLFAFVWIGFVLLLDPINYRWGQPSLLRELESGSVRTLLTLFVAGLICGILWEFWNYWAETKWVYTVPYFSEPKIFEMPLFGFLGFLPFAVECFVLWHFTRRILPASWTLISKDRTRMQGKG